MPKYKIGDVLRWKYKNSDCITLEKIIDIDKGMYELQIVESNTDTFKIGDIERFTTRQVDRVELVELAIDYIKEKDFNKDLKDLIDE